MDLSKYFVFIISSMILSIYALAADVWKVKKEESFVNFSVRSTFGKVDGKIQGIEASIQFSEDDLDNSQISATVKPALINTDNKKRDKHLRTADFLDVEKYPAIKFSSTKIRKESTGYFITGYLMIKDVRKEIDFPFTFERQNGKGVFKGVFSINRLDYHVGEKSRMVGEKVNIEIITIAE